MQINIKFLALAVAVVVAMLSVAHAHPRTRTVKDSRRALGSIENSIRNDKAVCQKYVPCGWALYHQRSSSALRPIYEYTKNTYCECAHNKECVYKENRSEMRAYVFYCRKVDSSEDFYRFPNTT